MKIEISIHSHQNGGFTIATIPEMHCKPEMIGAYTNQKDLIEGLRDYLLKQKLNEMKERREAEEHKPGDITWAN